MTFELENLSSIHTTTHIHTQSKFQIFHRIFRIGRTWNKTSMDHGLRPGQNEKKPSDYDPYFITAILFGWFIISASSFRYFIRVLNYEATDSKTILMNSERR